MNTGNSGAKPKAHFKYAQKMLATGCLHEGKITVRSWELKRREGVCAKGTHFWELMVHVLSLLGCCSYTQHLIQCCQDFGVEWISQGHLPSPQTYMSPILEHMYDPQFPAGVSECVVYLSLHWWWAGCQSVPRGYQHQETCRDQNKTDAHPRWHDSASLSSYICQEDEGGKK